MRRFEKIILGGVLLFCLALAVFVPFKMHTAKRLTQLRASVVKPAAIQFYEELVISKAEQPTDGDIEPTDTSPAANVAGWESLLGDLHAWRVRTGKLWREEGGEQHAPPESILERMRAMASKGGPLCALDFSKASSGGDEEDVYEEHLRDAGRCGAMLAAQARRLLMQGEHAEAEAYLIAVMQLADALAQEPLIKSQERRHQLYASLQEVLQAAPLPLEMATRLVERLGQGDLRASVKEALRGELYGGLVAYDAWKARSFKEEVDWDKGWRSAYWGTRNWLWARPMCEPWFNQDQETWIELVSDMAEIPEQPYYAVQARVMEIEETIDGLPDTKMVARWQADRVIEAFEHQAEHEARLDIMQIGILLEQYFAREGMYPTTLDVIADTLGGELPIDPFTGIPYRFERGDDHFLIWSDVPDKDGSGAAWRGVGREESNSEDQ